MSITEIKEPFTLTVACNVTDRDIAYHGGSADKAVAAARRIIDGKILGLGLTPIGGYRATNVNVYCPNLFVRLERECEVVV